MGLDDLLPNGTNVSQSPSPSEQDSSSEPDFAKVVGSGRYQKKFTEERWEKVQRVIREAFSYSVNEVLHLPAEKRYELLHEAVLYDEGKLDPDESEGLTECECYFCGNDCTKNNVEIRGEVFCIHHTAGQVANSLNDD